MKTLILSKGAMVLIALCLISCAENTQDLDTSVGNNGAATSLQMKVDCKTFHPHLFDFCEAIFTNGNQVK